MPLTNDQIGLIITGSMFILSEALPYLPTRASGILYVVISGLHTVKLIPDSTFHAMERRAGIDMNRDGRVGSKPLLVQKTDMGATSHSVPAAMV